MSKAIRVHAYGIATDNEDDGRAWDKAGVIEYEGEEVDAQLHANGALIIVEYVPNIEAGDGTKKADLLAIYKDWEWVEVVK